MAAGRDNRTVVVCLARTGKVRKVGKDGILDLGRGDCGPGLGSFRYPCQAPAKVLVPGETWMED